jgi:regulator of RNase E activity RraB
MRKSISKRTRFEVLKRDQFKCVYCGNSAPDFILHIDHVKPIADGGSSEIFNLVTSCDSCNLGKSDVPLNDYQSLSKQKLQMEIIENNQKELAELIEKQNRITGKENDEMEVISKYFKAFREIDLDDNEFKELKKLKNRFGLEELLISIKISMETYPTNHLACRKLGGILFNRKLERENPDLFEIMKIKRKFSRGSEDRRNFIAVCQELLEDGWTVDIIIKISKGTKSYDDFYEKLEKFLLFPD